MMISRFKDEKELNLLIDKITNYKRKRSKWIEALDKKEINEIVKKGNREYLRTTAVCEFIEPGDIEISFLRQLIKEFGTSEKAFEKFKSLTDVLWNLIPPYKLGAGNCYFDLDFLEDKFGSSEYHRHCYCRLDKGFDKFVEKIKDNLF